MAISEPYRSLSEIENLKKFYKLIPIWRCSPANFIQPVLCAAGTTPKTIKIEPVYLKIKMHKSEGLFAKRRGFATFFQFQSSGHFRPKMGHNFRRLLGTLNVLSVLSIVSIPGFD
jgi:hypothetical protein